MGTMFLAHGRENLRLDHGGMREPAESTISRAQSSANNLKPHFRLRLRVVHCITLQIYPFPSLFIHHISSPNTTP